MIFCSLRSEKLFSIYYAKYRAKDLRHKRCKNLSSKTWGKTRNCWG
jgi:hypothetical protein